MSEDKVSDKYKEQLDIAWTEYENENLEKVLAICNALTIEFPNDFGSYYLLGHVYFKQGKYEKALEKFSLALGKDKERKVGGHINYWIGQLYQDFDFFDQKNPIYDYTKSKQYYHKAKEYENYPLDVIYKLNYEYKNDYDRIKLFEEGISKFPKESAFYVYLSNIYLRLNDPKKEIEILNDAIKKGLKTSSLYYSKARFYFRNSQFSKSREYFIESLNLNEHYPNSNYAIKFAIANAYYKEGDLLNAEIYYRKSFEDCINDGTCWFGFFGLVIIYSEQNNFQEIQKLFNEIIINNKIFFEDEMLFLRPFWLDSQMTESIELTYHIKILTPILNSLKFPEKNDTLFGKLWLIRALYAKYFNNYSKQFTYLKNSLKYLSAYKYEFIYNELCSVYSNIIEQKCEKNQDIGKIIKSFKQDLANYYSDFRKFAVEFLDLIIGRLFKLKLYNDIVEIYNYFKEEQITRANIWFEVAYSLNELGKRNDAKKAYEMQIKINGESSATLNNLANIYKSENDLAKAIDLYKRALEIDPNDEIPKGNLKRSIKQFEDIETEKKQRKELDNYFKTAVKSLKHENDYVIEKLNNFLINVKKDENFKDWVVPIQKYKFPMWMGSDKQRAESLRTQWLNKNYIKETDSRDEHNVIIYFINPYLEAEIIKVNNNKIPESWIVGFNNLSILKLEEIGYFEILSRIQKVNKKFKPLLERDFNELVFNYVVQNEKATIVLSGSLIELVLTYYYEKKKTVQISYIDSKGKNRNKKLYDCVLNDLITFAEIKMLFGTDFPPLSNLSRIYRNYIHPGREIKDKIDKAKCDLCFISTTEILRKIL